MAVKYFCDICGSETKAGEIRKIRLNLPGAHRIDATISFYEAPAYDSAKGLSFNPAPILCDACFKQGIMGAGFLREG